MDNYKKMWDFPVVDNINFPNLNRIHPLMQRNVAKLYNELKSDENIERVILYGSALDFRCNSNSDIDLYIEKYNTDLKVKSLPDLEFEIDIIFNLDKSSRLYKEIDKMGLTLFEREKSDVWCEVV